MNDSTRQRVREANRLWRLAHPGYAKIHKANQKKLQAEFGCSLNGTLPAKPKEKTKYERTISIRKSTPEAFYPNDFE